jgi:hypothetical protein
LRELRPVLWQSRGDVVERPRPLLDLPVDLVLPAHGEPANRDELERVLS